MQIIADENHPAIFDVLLHGPSESSLRVLGELVGLIDDKHFEAATTLGLNVAVGGDFLDDILDDVAIVVVIVGWGHLDVVVAGEDTVLYGGRRSFGLEDPFLLF